MIIADTGRHWEAGWACAHHWNQISLPCWVSGGLNLGQEGEITWWTGGISPHSRWTQMTVGSEKRQRRGKSQRQHTVVGVADSLTKVVAVMLTVIVEGVSVVCVSRRPW